jgi:hypothetical protein
MLPSAAVCMLILPPVLGSPPVLGFESVTLRDSQLPSELQWTHAWQASEWATAASTLASRGFLDRALLYLGNAARLSDGEVDGTFHWLAFGRTLVALASSDPPYPLAAEDAVVEELASSALASATRAYGGVCQPSRELRELESATSTRLSAELHQLREEELRRCQATRSLARDVLAQLSACSALGPHELARAPITTLSTRTQLPSIPSSLESCTLRQR